MKYYCSFYFEFLFELVDERVEKSDIFDLSEIFPPTILVRYRFLADWQGASSREPGNAVPSLDGSCHRLGESAQGLVDFTSGVCYF